MNFARARLQHDHDELYLVLGSQRMRLSGSVPDAALARGDAPVVVGIRPEALSHAPLGGDDDEVLEAMVELVESLGSDLLVHAAVDAPAVLTEDQLEVAREVGGDPAADLARARFTVRLPPDVPVAAGDHLRLHVSTEHLHFFDPDTTLAMR
jgi:ABC-type sugar transport system ATPase subunit